MDKNGGGCVNMSEAKIYIQAENLHLGRAGGGVSSLNWGTWSLQTFPPQGGVQISLVGSPQWCVGDRWQGGDDDDVNGTKVDRLSREIKETKTTTPRLWVEQNMQL